MRSSFKGKHRKKPLPSHQPPRFFFKNVFLKHFFWIIKNTSAMPQSSSTCGPSRPLVPLWTQLHKDTKGVVGLPWAAPPGFPGSDHWNCLNLAHVIWGWGRQTRVKKNAIKTGAFLHLHKRAQESCWPTSPLLLAVCTCWLEKSRWIKKRIQIIAHTHLASLHTACWGHGKPPDIKSEIYRPP